MVEAMSEEYVDAARAKGLPNKIVIRRHARRNALLPTTTVIGLSFGFLLQGAVAVELIFRWPGLGQWVTSAVLAGDQATIIGLCFDHSINIYDREPCRRYRLCIPGQKGGVGRMTTGPGSSRKLRSHRRLRKALSRSSGLGGLEVGS